MMKNKSKRWMAMTMLLVVLCGLMAGGAMAAETETQPGDAISGATPPTDDARRGGQNDGQGRGDMPRDGRGGDRDRDRDGETRDMGLLGQIVSVSEDEIVLHMAERPERPAKADETQPAQGETPAEQPQGDVQTMSAALPADEDATQGDAAQDGTARGRRPEMKLSFATESTTYPLAQDVTVRAGRGPEAAEGSLGDLAAGDVVHLALNEAGEVTALVKVSGM